MPGFKKSPIYWPAGWQTDPALREAANFYADTTKAQWADLYFDVLTQLNGEVALTDAMSDAVKRLAILAKLGGKQ